MKYTLDTNILIGLSQRYPRDIFPGVWEQLEGLVSAGQSCICEAVLREVDRGGDELHGWAKNLPRFVCTTTDEELKTVAEIGIKHPTWVQGQINEADPFIVAHAKTEGSIVVTEEKRKGPGTDDKNQKIPNVAEEQNVPTMNFLDFLRSLGWRF